MLRSIAVLLLTGAGLLAGAGPSLACSCLEGSPHCLAFFQSDAVFAGEVLDITTMPATPAPALQTLQRRAVRFRVDHVWRGALGGEVIVRTGMGGGDCGFGFKRGRRYLVYASDRDGTLLTGICTRTQAIDEAQDSLAELRRMLDHPLTGSIAGRAQFRGSAGVPAHPAGGYTVTLAREGKQWTTRTDSSGQYEFPSMSPGTYSLKLTLGASDYPQAPSTIELQDSNSCAGTDFYVVPNSLLSTRVVGLSGRPIQDVEIDVGLFDPATQSVHPPTYSGRTGANGRVEFDRLSPGRYVIGVGIARQTYDPKAPPPTYFPGVRDLNQARIIDLKYGERIDLGTFVVPSVDRR